MNSEKDEEVMDVDLDLNASTSNAKTSQNNVAVGVVSEVGMKPTLPGFNVMANSSIIPSVTVSLHPLVIMNISEHWTRIRAQNSSKQQGKCLQ